VGQKGYAFPSLFLALIWVLFLIFAEPVRATHDAQHRFTVFGQVRDSEGRPVQDARVIVIDPRLEEEGGTTFTDPNGNYSQLLHLHNDNLGDEIVVRVGDMEKKINASFNVMDRTTERKARVDFGPTEQEVQAAKRFRFIGYGVAALLIVIGLIFLRFIWKKPAPQKPAS
jgi:hypothetical protein